MFLGLPARLNRFYLLDIQTYSVRIFALLCPWLGFIWRYFWLLRFVVDRILHFSNAIIYCIYILGVLLSQMWLGARRNIPSSQIRWINRIKRARIILLKCHIRLVCICVQCTLPNHITKIIQAGVWTIICCELLPVGITSKFGHCLTWYLWSIYISMFIRLIASLIAWCFEINNIYIIMRLSLFSFALLAPYALPIIDDLLSSPAISTYLCIHLTAHYLIGQIVLL